MQVEISTNQGKIKLELYPEQAPKTVANFIDLVKKNHFTNTIFHRVIKGFMIQGGGFEPNMIQKAETNPIENEANNKLSNTTGTIAMARTMQPHSASSQFFINVNDNLFLDFKNESPQGWGYCVFGKVIEGLDIVQQISTVDTQSMHGHDDVPVSDIVVEQIIEL